MAAVGVQMALNVIDIWFIGRISTKALAAVAGVQALMDSIMLVLSGGAIAVQTVVAQLFGAKRYIRAAKAVWTGIWGTLCLAPFFVLVAELSNLLLTPFNLDPQVQRLASEFWFPRMAGSAFGVAMSAVLAYFVGIGRAWPALHVSIIVAVINTLLNDAFIFQLGWGLGGSGWATTVAQAIGLVLSLVIFLGAEIRRDYRSHLTWRPQVVPILRQLRLGFFMGLLPAVDLLVFSLFEIMQVRFGTPAAAAAHLTVVLSSIGYIPGIAFAAAGMTLVAQTLGADNPAWARRLGTNVCLVTASCMGAIGVLVALIGPQLLHLFVTKNIEQGTAVIASASRLLWLAAAYQFFNGLYLGSSLSLRAAGDAVVPATLTLLLAGLVLLPLCHALTFARGQGWFNFLPQFGWGPIGGWTAMLLYMALLGVALFLRFRLRIWQSIRT
jgi:MATE family multidrug resistance protein